MKKLFLLLFFTQLVMYAWAQMSDEQVINMVQESRQKGMGQQEMLVMLYQQGVTQEQLMRIKSKYGDNLEKANANNTEVGDRMRVAEEEQYKEGGKVFSEAQKENKKTEPDVFGRDVFNNKLLTFEPNLNIATPETYILGPGDEVIVDIWGDSEQTFRQQISPEGTIIDPKIGPIYLNGVSVKEANIRLKNAFSHIYSTMSGSNPTTFIRLSLGQIRSIRVNVMGEVEVPGTYTLSSLASLFHAIYSTGGVNAIGSLRNVRLIRNGKELAKVDIYQYLLEGKSNLDIRLEDGDVIIVSPYQNLVTLQGKVKRPMIYEMKDSETVKQLLHYAGGFTGDAYKKAVRIICKSGREYQVFNIEEPGFAEFMLNDGDVVSVDSVLDRFENRVEIRGAVYRPGLYALGTVSTVKELIEKAEGVRGDAFVNRAVLQREKPDRTLEIEAVDVKGLLENKVTDITLRNNDVLLIPSIFDLQEDYMINISGAVGKPGAYEYAEGMTIEDLIIQAGGVKESASLVKIDVARRIKDSKSMEVGNVLAENFTLTLKDGLVVDGGKGFVLMPFDEVVVRRSPGYQEQQSVVIEGEVAFGGSYVLSKKGERLSDLVKKAGGLTPDAFISGARLVRQLNTDERIRVETLLKLTKQSSNKDSIDINRLDIGNTYYVGIDLGKALKNPGSEYDIVLREGDVLRVPEYTGTVKISGAVMYPNTVVYEKGANLKYYIGQGGGFADRAKKRKVFVVYMNGMVSKSRLLSKAKVKPGCEVIVPLKPMRKGMGLSEIMGLATSTTSMAALVTSIINSTK